MRKAEDAAGELNRTCRSRTPLQLVRLYGSRISALAAPSEVLVSSTVKDLVAGSGVSFDERGEHDLKGVPGTWRLYAVA